MMSLFSPQTPLPTRRGGLTRRGLRPRLASHFSFPYGVGGEGLGEGAGAYDPGSTGFQPVGTTLSQKTISTIS